MKQGWTYKKLGQLSSITAGQGAPQGEDNYCHDGTPFIKAANLVDLVKGYSEYSFQQVSDQIAKKHRLKLFRAGSVIFAKSGMSCMKGWVYVLKNDCYVVSHLAVVSPNGINSRFLHYYLQYSRPNSLVKDAAFPSISLKDIENLIVPDLPKDEQENIVERLDAAFAQIDELKNNAERQLAEARALFQSVMLIAFTPKAGWKSVKLGDICKIKSGSSTANNSSSGNLPYVKVADMNLPENSEFITTSTRFVDRYENEKGIFPVGSVIFPKRGGAILTNKKRLTNVEICCDLNIMGLVSKDTSVLNNDFLFQWFKQFDLSSVSSGTTVLQLNNCDITPVSIALPPLSIQKSIVEYLNDLSRRIRSLEEIFNKTVADCDALKQALLKQIFE